MVRPAGTHCELWSQPASERANLWRPCRTLERCRKRSAQVVTRKLAARRVDIAQHFALQTWAVRQLSSWATACLWLGYISSAGFSISLSLAAAAAAAAAVVVVSKYSRTHCDSSIDHSERPIVLFAPRRRLNCGTRTPSGRAKIIAPKSRIPRGQLL